MAYYNNGIIIEFDDNTQFLEGAIPTNAVATYQVHTVKEEETLFSIARLYYKGTPNWLLIADANDLQDVVVLEPGSTLIIPTYG